MKPWLLAFLIALGILSSIALWGIMFHFFPVATAISSLLVGLTIGIRWGFLS